jgi:hypothetical protein
VGSAKLTDSGIAVIDPASRRLRFYTRSGSSLASLKFDSGIVRHTSPIGVQSHGDTLFIVDIDSRRGIIAYDMKGQRVLGIRQSIPGVTAIVTLAGHRIVSSIPMEKDVVSRRAAVLWRVGADSILEQFGCVPDSLLRSSLQERTAYALFRFTGVSADEQRVYCRQALTPVIQIFRADGTPDGFLHRAPPFYRRGPAPRESGLDDAARERFRATWTEHAAFFPMRSGFVSLYWTYDANAKLDRRLLFACDSATGPTRCGIGELRGNPVDFLAPDTLVVAEPLDSAKAVWRLGLYVVRFQ